MVVPSGSVFLVKPISFSGSNCESNIVFQVKFHTISSNSISLPGEISHHQLQLSPLSPLLVIIIYIDLLRVSDDLCNLMQLDGKIIAPTNSQAWASGHLQWLEFTKLNGITVRGKGIIDGQGTVWWNEKNSATAMGKLPNTKPTVNPQHIYNSTTSNSITMSLINVGITIIYTGTKILWEFRCDSNWNYDPKQPTGSPKI